MPGSGTDCSRASGWFTPAVSASGEAGRHQTALRGRADVPSGTTTVTAQRATPQKPLRADEPAMQNGELDTRGVDGVGRRRTAGIETRVGRGGLPRAASAQLVRTRSSGRIGRAMVGFSRG